MRILLVTQQSPYPPNFGAAQRAHALIAALAEHHDVVLSCPLPPGQRSEAEQALRPLVSKFIWIDRADAGSQRLPQRGSRVTRLGLYAADLLQRATPFTFRRATPAWASAIADELLLADGVLCLRSALYPLVASGGRRKIVLDIDDLAFVVQWQQVTAGAHGFGTIFQVIETIRTFIAEQWIACRCARVLVVSAVDGRKLLAQSKSLAANGVTLERGGAERQPDDCTIVFVGQCGYEPNQAGLEWFVRAVWPRVRHLHSRARFQIVGRNANLEVLPFANTPGVELAGDVPSVRPWFEGAVASVVPLFAGAGTRIKIIESLGYGTAVISTPLGAAGLSEVFGVDQGLTLTPDADSMTGAICQALEDPPSQRLRALRGQGIVTARFSWQTTLQPVADGFASWIERHGA